MYKQSRLAQPAAIDRNPVTTWLEYAPYRVLLARARQGMVIVVPQGTPEDPTRDPSLYAGTYRYLQEIGIHEVA